MAELYYAADGTPLQLREGHPPDADIPLPPEPRQRITFDADTNAALVDGLRAEWERYQVVNGVLQRDGQPVPIAPESTEQQANTADRDALRAAVQALTSARDAVRADSAALATAYVAPASVGQLSQTNVTQINARLGDTDARLTALHTRDDQLRQAVKRADDACDLTLTVALRLLALLDRRGVL